MPFDFGFDFRATAGYVTDPAYAVGVLGFGSHAYPFTFTNGNGQSVNAGWTGSLDGTADRANTNDPRLAGLNYLGGNNTTPKFRVDLGSGSAAGAGNYDADIAIGDPAAGWAAQAWVVQDNTTVVVDLTNGGAGYNLAGSSKWVDATGAIIVATTTWAGTRARINFATLTCFVSHPTALSEYDTIAHFRLTEVAGPIPELSRWVYHLRTAPWP